MQTFPAAGGDTGGTAARAVSPAADPGVAQAADAVPAGHDAHAAGCACPRTADLDGDGIAASSRRTFLRGAGVLGAGAAAAGLLGAAPAYASGGGPTGADDDPYGRTTMTPTPKGKWSPDPDDPRFTVVVMPDTQYMFDEDRIHPVPMEASFRYVLDPAGRAGGSDENIVFLAHLGDVTNNGLAEEYAAATKVFDMLDRAGASYGVLAGNHDVSDDDQRGATPYLDTFGPARARRTPGYHSSSPDGYNTSHIFRAGAPGCCSPWTGACRTRVSRGPTRSSPTIRRCRSSSPPMRSSAPSTTAPRGCPTTGSRCGTG